MKKEKKDSIYAMAHISTQKILKYKKCMKIGLIIRNPKLHMLP